MARAPADALVSFYKFLPPYMHAPHMSIEAFCAGVFGGLSHSGGVWAHLCGWWARRLDKNVCWVCYETLRAHPEREIARVARFMGVPDDAATVARVAARTSLAAMRAAGPKYDDHFVFHRLKGQIGIHPSSIRRTEAGSAAPRPTAPVRTFDAWCSPAIPIWPLRRWKTKWSSYLGPAARIAASDVRAATCVEINQ